jgi:DNA topoisomerase-1
MAKTLVIVESPTKARTIERFLKTGYEVLASYGHVRDLPESADEIPDEIRKQKWGRLGVDTDGDFKPYYVVPNDKRKHVQALKAALKNASQVYLATDPDREGESISWHIKEILKPKVPVKRIIFHEITEQAINEAVKDAQDVNENLVRAQESRRILDRLYGYTLSPVLWKKVQTGLSAGRVQSVAVRLIVDREEERLAFKTASYWDLEAKLSGDGKEFVATLAKVGDARVATGKDFDANGVLTGKNARLLGESDVTTLAEALRTHLPWQVTSVDEKPGVERPAPPFTTSTLTQEASRKLGFSTERTMQAAQRLFQEGFISYHRTDSTTLSEKALTDSAAAIRELFGGEYYQGPRRYATKVKNAQEAHEAIRPADFTATPSALERSLDRDDLRLYELIWKRTMASQMVDARVLRTTVEITGTGASHDTAVFTASGKVIEFAGFRRAYVEGSDDPAAELSDQETALPKIAVGDRVQATGATNAALQLLALDSKGHETLPPARYTEASLIKELERLGIGRPSTYAATIGTIERRGYIFRQGKALVPSYTAFAVTHLLSKHFGDLIDVAFTAEMEEDLDEISRGEREWLDFIRQFYRGDTHHRGLEDAAKQAEERADYPLIEVGVDPDSGQPIRVRVGRYGPFLQVGEGGPGNTASLPPNQPPADLTVEKAMALVRAKAEGPRTLGHHASGQNIYVINGRFGAYVQLGENPEKGSKDKPKRSSLLPGMTDASITLDEATKLLDLPRPLGDHPESNEVIVAGLGRFGPYVKHGDDYRSLEASDDLFTIDLARALELFAQPKRAGRRQQAARKVIAKIEQPNGGTALQVLEGRYGPYVTDGETNASVPKGMDPATLSLDDALGLLDARRGAAPRRGRKGAAAGRGRAKKAAAAESATSDATPAKKRDTKKGKAKKAGSRKRAGA